MKGKWLKFSTIAGICFRIGIAVALAVAVVSTFLSNQRFKKVIDEEVALNQRYEKLIEEREKLNQKYDELNKSYAKRLPNINLNVD